MTHLVKLKYTTSELRSTQEIQVNRIFSFFDKQAIRVAHTYCPIHILRDHEIIR